MALVACPDCGAEVSTVAAFCPKCGRARPRQDPAVPWLVICGALGIVALIAVYKFVQAVRSTETMTHDQMAALPQPKVKEEICIASLADSTAPIPLMSSEERVLRMYGAVRNQDHQRVAEFLADSELLDSSTHVRVDARSLGVVQVTVLEGPARDHRGFIWDEYCKKTVFMTR